MEKLLKSIAKKRNVIIEEERDDGRFHSPSYRPCGKCKNSSSYGTICVGCGKCGRKFIEVKKINNNMDRFIILCRVLLKI